MKIESSMYLDICDTILYMRIESSMYLDVNVFSRM